MFEQGPDSSALFAPFLLGCGSPHTILSREALSVLSEKGDYNGMKRLGILEVKGDEALN